MIQSNYHFLYINNFKLWGAEVLDYRTKTFLTLCEEMNYRKTAEKLNMTQPGVTQHIHLLEREYGCSLFSYNGKTLTLTAEGKLLRTHLLQVMYNENWLRQEFSAAKMPTLRIGATKSIGDYMIAPDLIKLIRSGEFTVDLSIDNTQNLLENLEQGKMDFAMIEGDFDKTRWGSRKMWSEPFCGICAINHPFAGKTVLIEQLLSQHLLLRETGSGTRAIFEAGMNALGYRIDSFHKVNNISSFYVLRELIAQSDAISFGYSSVIKGDHRLSNFTVEGFPNTHDLYYVYQKNTYAETLLKKYLEIIK
ncbi:MAG: LysR family transcriptional regulator [Oscillospiraceae bacterium]|nr:LysR family transcriptional regulator [Oscillospiraceae bacterium]